MKIEGCLDKKEQGNHDNQNEITIIGILKEGHWENAYNFLTKIVRELWFSSFEREDRGTYIYGESKVFPSVIHVENSF